MKKIIAVLLSVMMVVSLASCGNTGKSSKGKIEVMSGFAGEDGNVDPFRNACKGWEEKTGNKVVDLSVVVDESFKSRVATDFETGSEPDVLFFYTESDSDSFIRDNKVVSIEEIQEEYPDFASNINMDDVPVSEVDGKQYAIPIIGYWEGLFVNKAVLKEAGVEMPGTGYTWDQFLVDCGKIKDAGYIPIAVALGDVPHYWWEYSILNHTGVEDHLTIPGSVEEPVGQAWVQAMEDIKYLYECGYFPENTLSAMDEETLAAFQDDKAAFLVDGSWRVGGIVKSCQSDPKDPGTLDRERLENFEVTYFPGTEVRPATEILGGFSMGYYITRSAWEDPETRELAVDFVSYMTSDEIVPTFATYTTTALKNDQPLDEKKYNSIQISAIKMLNNRTGLVGAVQDDYSGECRVSTFDGLPDIVTGKVNSVDAVQEGLDIYKRTN